MLVPEFSKLSVFVTEGTSLSLPEVKETISLVFISDCLLFSVWNTVCLMEDVIRQPDQFTTNLHQNTGHHNAMPFFSNDTLRDEQDKPDS
jgi:hypothetical protein